jgi:hypothetical protein
MDEKDLTPWFPPEVKPVRRGVYIAMVNPLNPADSPYYRRWNGREWLIGGVSPTQAAERPPHPIEAAISWRGLAHPPKGA